MMIFIIKNPAKNLQVPQTESKKRTAIEQQQIDLFMGYVKNSERYSYSYPAFVVLFYLGMRIGDAHVIIRLKLEQTQ